MKTDDDTPSERSAAHWYTCVHCAMYGFCRGLDNGAGWCGNYTERGEQAMTRHYKRRVMREDNPIENPCPQSE